MTAQSTTIANDSVQQLIDKGLQNLETKLMEKFTSLKDTIAKDMNQLWQNIDDQIESVISKMMDTMTGTKSPFVTKEEHQSMHAMVSQMDHTMKAILAHLNAQKS